MVTKATETKTKTKTTQVNTFDEKLAKFAKRATASVAQNLGGKMISTASGIFTIDGQKTEDFEGVILDLCNVKTYYAKAWTKDSADSPDCYAVARDIDELAPHKNVKKPICTSCAECRWNKFGTAVQGRSKMCADRIRLHIIKPTEVGEQIVEPYTLSVPPTSLKAFANYAKGIEDLGLCLQVVRTTFHIERDDDTQFRLSFDMADQLEDEQAGQMLDLAERVGDAVLAPFPDKPTTAQAAPAPARSKVTGGKKR